MIRFVGRFTDSVLNLRTLDVGLCLMLGDIYTSIAYE